MPRGRRAGFAALFPALLVACALLGTGCGGEDPTTPPGGDPNRVEAVIGPEGGSLISSDGVLTLVVPPLAFDRPNRLSIETMAGKAASYGIASEEPSPAVAVLAHWDLGAFSRPEDHRFRHVFRWLRATSEEPTPQPAAQCLRLDGESGRVEVSGELAWLDLWLSCEEEPLQLGLGPVPPEGLAGSRLFLEAELEQSANSGVSGQPRYLDRVHELPAPRALELVAASEDPLPGLEAGTALGFQGLVAEYRWVEAPSGRFLAELRIEGPVVDGLSWTGDWRLELFLPVRGTEITPGGQTFPARTAFPTGLIVPPPSWGPFAGQPAVGVVGSDGVVFLDAESGILLNGDLVGDEGLLGGVALSNAGLPAPLRLLEALFVHGSGGAGLSVYAWGMGAFPPPTAIESGAEVVDAAPYGGDPTSGGLCYAMPTLDEVGFVEPDPTGDRFERAALRIDVTSFPDRPGPVISAYRREFGSEVLVLCDGQPGALYLWDPADSSVVELGRVGNEPAQLRGMGTVAAVSNFGSEEITLVEWPEGSSPRLRTTLPAVGGPRGLDLRPVDAEFELVTGAFSRDQLLRYRLSGTAAVIGTEELPLPEGCSGPSGAVHLPDGVVVLAGFLSDTIARIDPPSSTP